MGLCKCPKRKVTNQFCFEHRVNVCEHCLVSTHPKCVVKSYLHWLQDSDYTPSCLICNEDLSQNDCLRLQCYDVFHWHCLGQLASRIAPSSLKTELVCPTCKTPILPPEKLVSPVADAVREKLSSVEWGRKLLGLPPEEKKVEAVATRPSQARATSNIPRAEPEVTVVPQKTSNSSPEDHTPKQTPLVSPLLSPVQPHSYSASPNASYNHYNRDTYFTESQSPRKVYDTRQEERLNIPYDHDENKYKKKGFLVWLGALLSLRNRPKGRSADEPRLTFKRVFIMLLLLVIGFMTVVLILSHVGRGFANSDPLLDPKANPNIHVDDSKFVS